MYLKDFVFYKVEMPKTALTLHMSPNLSTVNGTVSQQGASYVRTRTDKSVPIPAIMRQTVQVDMCLPFQPAASVCVRACVCVCFTGFRVAAV
jgi:hypothetical protein